MIALRRFMPLLLALTLAPSGWRRGARGESTA